MYLPTKPFVNFFDIYIKVWRVLHRNGSPHYTAKGYCKNLS